MANLTRAALTNHRQLSNNLRGFPSFHLQSFAPPYLLLVNRGPDPMSPLTYEAKSHREAERDQCEVDQGHMHPVHILPAVPHANN